MKHQSTIVSTFLILFGGSAAWQTDSGFRFLFYILILLLGVAIWAYSRFLNKIDED